jgi:hypothetical protein
VIEVTVREQDARQPFEADARLQNLALCALAAVHEEAILVVTDDLRRKSALGGGGGSGCAEKKNFEQRRILE